MDDAPKGGWRATRNKKHVQDSGRDQEDGDGEMQESYPDGRALEKTRREIDARVGALLRGKIV